MLQNTVNFLQNELTRHRAEGRHCYMSSSFQTQSVPLLHIISSHFNWVPVVFIDTGFHFAETYAFKDQLQRQFNLKVITVASNKSYVEQKTADGLFMYSEDTDRCCAINKVEPIDSLVKPGDVWISGVRRDQTAIRNRMQPLEEDKRGVIRLHPMLKWNSKSIYDYIKEYKLPKHPLENAGFVSIGCVPCTQKWDGNAMRGGRWIGRNKMECGLHTENRTI